jgi:glycine/D-amino acid oxidase-like deaminating enzyme
LTTSRRVLSAAKVQSALMRTRYGLSPWTLDVPASRKVLYPRFRGEADSRVVVVGAGLTGCAVAHACAAAGLETLVLEADRVGAGATSRGPGLLSAEPGPSFREVAAAHGLRDARRVFDTWRTGAAQGAALLRRLRINCQLEPRETLVVARGDDEPELRKELAARSAAGFDLAWQTPKQLASRMNLDAQGGLRLREGFVLDPYRACLGLATAAVRKGAVIYEQSPVIRVRFTRKDAEVVTARGRVRTSAVIVTTGTATAEFKGLRRHFKPRETYLAMTEPVPAAMRKALGDRAAVLHSAGPEAFSARWAPDDRLLLCGGDQDETSLKARPSVLVQRTGQLMYDLLRTYPAISGLQPEFGWEASYGRSADGLMYIGAHRNYPHHLFALGGWGSITGAFVAARILLRALEGDSEKADEVFGWTR